MIRLSKTTKSIGDYYEDVALDHLDEMGCTLVARNYSSRFGEIDLIVFDRKVLVFTEVRYRRSANYGTPLDTVTTKKQQKLIRCAEHFLASHAKYRSLECRFDAIAITGDNRHLDIQWIRQAFTT